jgi:hypothetical protein
VQISPDGLQLLRRGTLTITPRQAIPVVRRAPFAWRGSGRDAHLYPSTSRSPTVLTLGILHFCGYGEAVATTAQLAQIEKRGHIDVGTEIEATMGETLTGMAREQLPFGSQAAKDRLAAALLPAYRSLVARLHNAESGGNWRTPVGNAVALDSWLNLTGYSDETLGFHPPTSSNRAVAQELETLRVAIQASFWRVQENAYDRAKTGCADTGRYEYAAEMARIASWLAQWMRPDHYIPPDQLKQDAQPCTCDPPRQQAWVSPNGIAAPVTANKPTADSKLMCWPVRQYQATLTLDYSTTEVLGQTEDESFHATITAVWRMTEARLITKLVRATYTLVSISGSYTDTARSSPSSPDDAIQGCRYSGGGPLTFPRPASESEMFLQAGPPRPYLSANVQWGALAVPGTCDTASGGSFQIDHLPWPGSITLSEVPATAGTFGELIAGAQTNNPDDLPSNKPTAHITKSWRLVAQR